MAIRPFACLFPALYLKTDAAGITKREVQTSHDESWKTIYFEAKRLKVKVTSHKTVPTWVFALL